MASGHVHSRLPTKRPTRARGPGPDATAFTPIVGRDAELGLLREQLADPSVRLLTMTGPAGVGKTRLALALADDLHGPPEFHDLAGYDRAADVLDALAARPAERDRLIVLDQGEHFTEALAAGLPRLLADRPATRVLLVSREPLHLYGERVLRVPPLARVASLELFRQRAVAVRPDFSLDGGVRAQVAGLCELLDDLPLAIEFAAARLKLFRPAELLDRLRAGQDVLYGGPTLSHHASMRAAIGWSYDRLTGPEQAVFRALAVREGAFCPMDDTELAPEIIETLVDKNLLVPLPSMGGEPRFRVLNVVRSFTRDLDPGARPVLRGAGEQAPPAPAGARRARSRTQPLTPREQEVAMLVAQGLTNRQIAGRLGIAEWTAVNHVRNVMRKLDCTSRVNVASWVLRDGAVAGAID
ncbi:LuxR C-terminal-related transcriptional regulator [Spirillospora sp. CA-255316]